MVAKGNLCDFCRLINVKVYAFILSSASLFVDYLYAVTLLVLNTRVSAFASCIFEQFPICFSSLYYEGTDSLLWMFYHSSLCSISKRSDSGEIEWSRNNECFFLILFFVASLFCSMLCILHARSPICRLCRLLTCIGDIQ